MKITLEQIGNQIQEFFADGVEAIACETKFVQRASKLTGVKFLQGLVFASLEKKELTLSRISQSCLDLGVSIREQGIDERIDDESVNFLCEMFRQAMQRFRLNERISVHLLEQFTGIYLIDSSQISLPANMKGLFPGAGGNASPASLKIQLVFDYLCGQLAQLELCSGREPDQGYRGHWSMIQKGALFLMDLGYFVLDSFRQISDKGGYFLSRFQAQTALLTASGQRLELAQLLAAQSETVSEIAVLMGNRSQHQIPCRLILIRLAQAVADRQRQKAKENARRHGRTVTQEYLKLLDWALFVTTVPATMLQMEHVASLYRIRWQVELVFKMCKSFCGLDSISSFRPQRILTELYARLIGVVLTYFLIAPVRLPEAPTANREISPGKVRLIFQRFARTWHLALFHKHDFVAQLRAFFDHVVHAGFKQKRRKSPNSLHALALLSACYDWDWAESAFSADFCASQSLA